MYTVLCVLISQDVGYTYFPLYKGLQPRLLDLSKS
uniref:Uncharacterized protein n=1 Tax=Ciona intestinalis TaxID=7719 RepID=H2XMI1_CIOIN